MNYHFFYKNSNCRKESLNCCPLMNFLWKLYVWRISTCRTSMEKNFKNAQKTHKALFLFLLRMKFAYFAKVAFIKCFKLMDNCMNFGYFEIVAIIKYFKLIGTLCAKTLKKLTCTHTSNHQHAIQRSYIGQYNTIFCNNNRKSSIITLLIPLLLGAIVLIGMKYEL